MNEGLGAGEASAAAHAADVRMLRRVDLPTGPTPEGEDLVTGIGVIVGLSTTGFAQADDTVIELAARRFSYDAKHVITRIDRGYLWRQDPGKSLPSDIVRLSGVTDADLAGTSIDVLQARAVLGSVTIRIAHNARFARRFVEDLLPDLSERHWACSIDDVGWTSRGFDSAQLGSILTCCGFFNDVHGVEADVNATIQILRHELEPGRTALSILMENAAQASWMVRTFGAAFHLKGTLRSRGYRWDPLQRVWWREVRDRVAEEKWLMANVYHPGSMSRGTASFERVDWSSRYA